MSIEDSGVAGNDGTDLSNDVPQAITDKFNEIFSNEDVASNPIEAEPAKPQFPTKASQAKAKREQTDELKQEGLEDEDGLEPEAVEPDADAATDEDAPVEEEVQADPLDPNLRFAAEQFGWTAEAIDKLYAADPEMATATFTNLLGAFQNLSRQMNGGGNPAGQPASQLPNPAAQLQQQAQQSKFLSMISNLKEFSEVNGEPMGELLKALHEEVYQPLKQIQADYAVAKQQAVAAEAMTVTDNLAGKFKDFYGQGERLTLVQQQNRSLLYQYADRQRAGASQQGREMSVKDALNQAHLILTADRRVAEGRQQVRSQVQKRSKSITARPTQRVNPRGAGTSKGESQAAEAYSRRAQELGIEVGYSE